MSLDAYSAIVLAGGRSSRMGTDKAALAWNGASLIQHMVAQLRRRFCEVIIVSRPDQAGAVSDVGARVVFDDEPFEGPVKALHLGLSAIKTEVAFACGCDLPFLNGELAKALCALAAGYDAAIPQIEGRLQVLHAAYQRNCAPALQTMIEAGQHKLQELVPLLRARMVNESELRRHDRPLLSFFNVNTPTQYQQALRLARSKPQP
jgi:molybdopterin-guanine dinucleotide biosynthesis protein A